LFVVFRLVLCGLSICLQRGLCFFGFPEGVGKTRLVRLVASAPSNVCNS